MTSGLDYLKLTREGKKAAGRGLPKIKSALLSDAATQLPVPLFRALFPGLRGTGGGSRVVRGYNARCISQGILVDQPKNVARLHRSCGRARHLARLNATVVLEPAFKTTCGAVTSPS